MNDAENARLNRIGRELHERIRRALETDPADATPATDSQTDRITRLLALWLDLQQALHQADRPQSPPWLSNDTRVASVWRQITHPQNQRGLEEWLFQVTPGQWEVWAQAALIESRRRAATDDS
jgi:hypothetical protein